MLARHTDNPLRRRRAAALRCPPLADGFRDPLDRAAPHWTEDRVRELANTLAAQGFSVEYIAHRYGIRPRPKSTQHCPCCRHHQEAA